MRYPVPTIDPHWHPLGARSLYDLPVEGAIVAWRHAVWRIVEIRDVPEDLWTDADHERTRYYTSEAQEKCKLRVLTLRPITNSDIKIQASQDRHVGIGGRFYYASALSRTVHIYPDEHYPVCATCGEPVPCREKEIERAMERAEKEARRYEVPGVCPACSEPVTSRQRSITFEDNIEIPLGPPVTFHLRGQCHDGAVRYEQRLVETDPERRRTTLSCPGCITSHNDGTYECTEYDRCPGSSAWHSGYQTCNCPDCHARGDFNCYPLPTDVLRDRPEES